MMAAACERLRVRPLSSSIAVAVFTLIRGTSSAGKCIARYPSTARSSSSVPLAPSALIFRRVPAHPLRSCRTDITTSAAWHCEQSRAVSCLPGPSGSCAAAARGAGAPSEAMTITAAQRTSVLQWESEGVHYAITGGHVHLAAARRQSKLRDGRNRGPAVPQLVAGRPIEGAEDHQRGGRHAAGHGENDVVVDDRRVRYR